MDLIYVIFQGGIDFIHQNMTKLLQCNNPIEAKDVIYLKGTLWNFCFELMVQFMFLIQNWF